jgi:hypothetical protein
MTVLSFTDPKARKEARDVSVIIQGLDFGLCSIAGYNQLKGMK